MVYKRVSKILFYDNAFIEWSVRLLLTVNLIIPGFNYGTSSYPLSVLLLTLISLWLYLFKLKGLSIIFLLLALYINCQHIGAYNISQ